MPAYIPYNNEYYDDLFDMCNDLYKEDPGDEVITELKIKNTIYHAMEYPEKVQIYLIKESNRIAGYAILSYRWSNEFGGDITHIDEIYVKERFRKQGLASNFMEWVEERSPIGYLMIETTRSNDKAYHFYTEHGYIPYRYIVLEKNIIE